MSEQYCDKTDLPVDMCAHCKGHDDSDIPHSGSSVWQEPDYGVPTSTHQIATFPGWCPSCRRAIERGDIIYRATEGRWLCENCGDRKEHDDR